jgi:hypothetical protein
MTDQTIQEAAANYSEKAAGILWGWHETLDEIARSREPVEGEYLERLTDAGREQLIREQQTERAHTEREKYLREYRELTEEHHEQVKSRTRFLSERLFKVAGTPGEAVLPLASSATEEQLMGMLEDALTGGSFDQARAVFVVAQRRQLAGVMGAYLDRADREARALYEEWKAAPSEEIMERRLAGVETLTSPPDSSHFAWVPTFGVY